MIVHCALQCRDSFRACIKESHPACQGWLLNRMVEFELWATSTGATLDTYGSLDYRLKDRPDLRDMITQLVSLLHDALQRLKGPFARETAPSKPPLETTELHDRMQNEYDRAPMDHESQEKSDLHDTSIPHSSSSPWIDSSDDWSHHSTPEPQEHRPHELSPELSFQITGAIEQLNRLASAIQRLGNLIRHEKADKTLVLTDYADFTKSLKFYLARKLLSRTEEGMSILQSESFSHTEDSTKSILIGEALDLRQRLVTTTLISVQDRLIKGNLKRRHRILHAKSHADIYQTVQKATFPDGEFWSSEDPAEGSRMSQAKDSRPASDLEAEEFRVQPSGLPTATGTSGVVSQPSFAPQSQSSAAALPQSATGATVDFPWPPLTDSDASNFQCPCCFHILDGTYSDNDTWRAHIKQDLEPYSCIYSRCPQPDEFYHTFDAWIHHMQSVHGEKVWKCAFCNTDHIQSFSTEGELKYHMRVSHDEECFTEAQLLFLVKKSLKYTTPAIKCCPVCARDEGDFDDASAMQHHIAEELLVFALEAIPESRTSHKLDSTISNDQRSRIFDEGGLERIGDLDLVESTMLDPSHRMIEGIGDAEWGALNLLSLDGGGVRGYWSLLALERLFYHVGVEEEKEKVNHSFYPEDWPTHVYQAPIAEEEQRHIDAAFDEEEKCNRLPHNRRYLPCHYFDYMCGSSTGALIAIMLGRLRMTIPDCIAEYQRLGREVFGKPRMISALRFGVGSRDKYKSATLEKLFKDIARRRTSKAGLDQYGKVMFPSGQDLCATFVTTMRSKHPSSSESYLMRSFDNDQPHQADSVRTPAFKTNLRPGMSDRGESAQVNATKRHSRRHNGLDIGNYGKATNLEIWQVARAATAATFYFEPLKIQIEQSEGFFEFRDGGFDESQNPTLAGKRELKALHGDNSIGIVVSVGTARKLPQDAKQAKFLSTISDAARKLGDLANDPELVHNYLQRQRDEIHDFEYYRLNDLGGLKVDLDEWEPRSNPFSEKESGVKTIATIERAFSQWASKHENIRWLEQCAATLVACRRQRMHSLKWERYATGSSYKCRIAGCDAGEFPHREQFRSHLLDHFQDINVDDELDQCRRQWQYQAAPED